MKVIFSGLEDSGKSLKLAMTAANIAYRNHRWYERQLDDYEDLGKIGFQEKYKIAEPVRRPIRSNIVFMPHFYDHVTKELGVPILYWENIDSFLFQDDCDVFIDEVARYFNARRWADLSTDALGWLGQSSKRGVEVYGGAQDFSQVDGQFRLLVGGRGGLYHIRKLVGSARPTATRPPVRHIWGVCSMMQLDPVGYDQATSLFKPVSVIPSFFFIERKYCEIFNTKQKLAEGKPPKLRHRERVCEHDWCPVKHLTHA